VLPSAIASVRGFLGAMPQYGEGGKSLVKGVDETQRREDEKEKEEGFGN